MQSLPWQKVPDPFTRRLAKSANLFPKNSRTAQNSPQISGNKIPRATQLKMGHQLR